MEQLPLKEMVRLVDIEDRIMNEHRYDNMLNLERPKCAKPMSSDNRAAQFSAFAALTGYENYIEEASRLTESEVELSDAQISVLDQKLAYINEHLNDRRTVSITYFIPDYEIYAKSTKKGGEYIVHKGIIKKIDLYTHTITFDDETKISMSRIVDIDIS